jgi:beta-fructofuranosidase
VISEDVTVSSTRGILPSMRFWLLCALVARMGAWTHSTAAVPSSVVPETPTRPENPPASWVTYHLAHPGWTAPGDPNGAFFWKGRYHLHYIYEGRDGVSWAHVSSRDMVHWRWHPTTLTPATMGHGLFSGTGFLTREGRPAIIYHGEGSGRNQIAFAEDDLLERWSKPIPVDPRTSSGELPAMRHWDPDCWLDGDTYYAISGGRDPHLMKSTDLRRWDYIGPLLHERMPSLDVPRDEDISCPNMFRMGDRWMLLCLSHWIGSRYYLGRFEDGRFLPDVHGRLNWMCAFQGGDEDADLFAPESLLTPDGRRVMWAWSRVKHRLHGVSMQGSIQCLPRELSLPPDGVLRIRPIRELESLRRGRMSERAITVEAGTRHRLRRIAGDTLELELRLRPGDARRCGVEVHCDADGRNGFPISFEPGTQTLSLGETQIPFTLPPNEDLKLRVFIDKSLIEVFANDRIAALSPHRYEPGNVGISLFSEGAPIRFEGLRAWQMHPMSTTR